MYSGGSRICKREAKVERRRRENRGAEGCEVWGVVPLPTGEGPGESNAPFPIFWILDLTMSTSSAFWALFFAVQLAVVHAKNTAFGLRKLAAVCKLTAKGGKANLMETTRGTIVSFCVQ